MSSPIVHALPGGESNETPPTPVTRKKRPALPSLAWFAGVNKELLNQSPSDKAFYNAVGLAVLLTAILSGVALTVRVGLRPQ